MKYLALLELRIPGGPPRRQAAEGARTRPGLNQINLENCCFPEQKLEKTKKY